jgi:hypothetical protein
MIALRDGTPLIALPDGRNAFFEKCWIATSLRHAAEHVGYEHWWLAEHIAESVSVYLKRDCEETSVPVVNLQEAVLEVLESLGFHDVAEHFRLPNPPLHLSLADLVREAGEGYELAFFGLLGSRLQSITISHVARLEISDLSDCLRLLGRKKCCHKGENLREEIVTFIRQQGEALSTSHQGQRLEIQLS